MTSFAMTPIARRSPRQFDPTDRPRAQSRFREFVSRPRDVEYDPHAAAVGGWILGSPAFCDRVQQWIDEKERSRAHPKRQRYLVLPAIQALVEIVHGECGDQLPPSRWS
ncbi:MAG: hypothetical protein LC732_01920, partial [Acidobacteria bacterium]|nr:hypothetical protein [Acidobacteriota bacterium]